MSLARDLAARIDADRLAHRALDLVRIPSPTGQTRDVARWFADTCRSFGFAVTVIDDIPGAPAGADAPSVAARIAGAGSAPSLQIDGHTDTVPVPHDPPRLENGVLHGRGASDMKGGLAAALEAVSVLREADIRLPGDLILTTHGLHEAPSGHGEGLQALLDAGHRGTAGIVVEGPADILAIAGRGMTIYEIAISGPAGSTHENETPPDTPHPIVAAGELLAALERERLRLRDVEQPYVGAETLFVGQVHGGDFYNRFPTVCRLQGTRRYFGDHPFAAVTEEFRAIAAGVARHTGTTIDVTFDRIRDGFRLDEDAPIVRANRAAYREVTGRDLPLGAFKSVGDVSILVGNGIPAVYCGNRGTGAHADHEQVAVADLVEQAAVVLGTLLRFYGME